MRDEHQWQPGPRQRVVAILRLTGIVVATLPMAASLGIMRIVTRGDKRRRLRNRHVGAWSRLVLRLLGARTIVQGAPPAAPFFLASNHHGYLDILVLAQHLPTTFVSKAEVRHWPVIGWLTRLADTHYIDRSRRSDIPRANASIARALSTGDSVALFPEGTSSDSDTVLPVRSSLLDGPATGAWPVWTAALRFETRDGDPPASSAICYVGDMVFAPHFWRLLHLRGFDVSLRFSDAPTSARDRKQLASQVEREILDLQAQLAGRTAAAEQTTITAPARHPEPQSRLHPE